MSALVDDLPPTRRTAQGILLHPLTTDVAQVLGVGVHASMAHGDPSMLQNTLQRGGAMAALGAEDTGRDRVCC